MHGTDDPSRRASLKKQDGAHEPECTSLCASPRKDWRDHLSVKANGARNQAYCANYAFQLVKLYFACSACCYKETIFNLELDTCASRARLVLQTCDFPAGAGTSRTRLALHSCDCPQLSSPTVLVGLCRNLIAVPQSCIIAT